MRNDRNITKQDTYKSYWSHFKHCLSTATHKLRETERNALTTASPQNEIQSRYLLSKKQKC